MMESASSSQSAGPDKMIEEFRADLRDNVLRTARLEGRLSQLNQVFAGVGLLVALLGLAGTYNYFETFNDLKDKVKDAMTAQQEAQVALTSASKMSLDYAALAQQSTIDSIDSEFSQQDSLDSFRNRPELVAEIDRLVTKLNAQSSMLQETDKSTYPLIVTALHAYIGTEYLVALQKLDGVRDTDREHYIYYYMRGVCLLRTGNREDARKCFAHARGLTEGHRRLLLMNAEAVSDLEESVATGDQQQTEHAITTLEEIIRQDSAYAPAYFNLAASYARLGRQHFDAVTCYLVFPTKRGIREWPVMVSRIRDDLNEPTERHLKEYVRSYLDVSVPVADSDWEDRVHTTLDAKWDELLSSGKKCPQDFGLHKESVRVAAP